MCRFIVLFYGIVCLNIWYFQPYFPLLETKSHKLHFLLGHPSVSDQIALSLASLQKMLQIPLKNWNAKGFKKEIIDAWFRGDEKDDISIAWIDIVYKW